MATDYSYKAVPVERGCGERNAGGCYAESGLAPEGMGKPLEWFILDPPVPLNQEARDRMGLTAVGVTLIERAGVWHVVDWVGEKHYPLPTDFLEEGRRFGFSRRLPVSLDFSKLTEDSKLLLVHPKAWIKDCPTYYDARRHHLEASVQAGWEMPVPFCPKQMPAHMQWADPPTMCSGAWWLDGDPPGVSHSGAIDPVLLRQMNGSMPGSDDCVYRQMPSFSYVMHQRPIDKPSYIPAMFVVLPITRLVVIRDPAGGKHEQTADKASHAHILLEFEDK